MLVRSFGFSVRCAVPQSFAIENDEKIPNVHHQGIEINIADMSSQYSPLLHGFQNNPKVRAIFSSNIAPQLTRQQYKAMREEVFANSKEFERFARERAVEELALKLWEMTEFSKLNPQHDLVKRIKCFQVPSTLHLYLSKRERERMRFT